MNIRYVSASGVTVNFDVTEKIPYQSQNLFDSSWNVQSVDLVGGGAVIQKLLRGLRTYTVRIGTWARTQSELRERLDYIHSVFDADCANNQRGRLYVGDYYVEGNFTGSDKDGDPCDGWIFINLTFLTGSAFWVTEELHSYQIVTTSPDLPFPTEVPFSLTSGQISRLLINNHYAASKAIITMFGPFTDPAFTVSGNTYSMTGALEAGERYIINQPAQTITKISATGIETNVFGLRGKAFSVFTPIPKGENVLYISGDYVLDVVLLKERSEPLWS